MEKYARVKKERNAEDIKDNEVRLTKRGYLALCERLPLNGASGSKAGLACFKLA
jgi:hypothetical protein